MKPAFFHLLNINQHSEIGENHQQPYNRSMWALSCNSQLMSEGLFSADYRNTTSFQIK